MADVYIWRSAKLHPRNYCTVDTDSCHYGHIEPDRFGNFPAKTAGRKCGGAVNQNDVERNCTITSFKRNVIDGFRLKGGGSAWMY